MTAQVIWQVQALPELLRGVGMFLVVASAGMLVLARLDAVELLGVVCAIVGTASAVIALFLLAVA